MPGFDLPLLGKLSSLPIYSYGVMLGLSLVVGWYLTLGLAEADGLDREKMANNYVVTALVAVLGSRIAYVVTNLGEFKTVADVLSFRAGGLVAYGGFLGGFLGSYAYMRLRGLRLLPWADVAIPSLASGLLITRIGCYMFGCDYGRPLSAGAPAWLKALGTFPKWAASMVPDSAGSPAWAEHVARHLVEADATASLPVHPTQLYESLIGLLMLVILFRVRAHQTFRGQVFFVGTFVYGLLRFMLEMLRDDPERGSVAVAFPRHLLLPACVALFAAAYAFGPSRLLNNERVRTVTIVAAFAPAVVLWWQLRPASFALPEPASLSTSQLIGMTTALLVAAFYAAHDRAARANPDAAMALGGGGAAAKFAVPNSGSVDDGAAGGAAGGAARSTDNGAADRTDDGAAGGPAPGDSGGVAIGPEDDGEGIERKQPRAGKG